MDLTSILPIERIVVETTYGPKIILQDPLAPSDPNAPPNPFMVDLKPSASIYLKGSSTPITYAPHGPPGESKWPLVRNSLIAFGLLAGYIVYRGIRY